MYLYKQIVPSRYGLHDVPFDLLVLQDGEPVVNQDRRVRRFEVGAEVGRRLLHIYCCDLETVRNMFSWLRAPLT